MGSTIIFKYSSFVAVFRIMLIANNAELCVMSP
jgi:hypothetical protein